jgi:hypothetical protein
VLVTIATGTGNSSMVRARSSKEPRGSSTRRVKAKVPHSEGVPVIAAEGVPEGASVNPAGKLPCTIDQA